MIGWTAFLANLFSLVLIGPCKNRYGWLVGIGAESLWLVRAYEKVLPELMLISVVYIGIASVSFVRWGRV